MPVRRPAPVLPSSTSAAPERPAPAPKEPERITLRSSKNNIERNKEREKEKEREEERAKERDLQEEANVDALLF
jgi:hypothetical protein